MNILLFDMDDVLLQPLGYHLALAETVRLIAKSLGYGDIVLGPQEIAAFESSGVTSEWDSAAICAALLLRRAWESSPQLCMPDTLPADQLGNPQHAAPDFEAFFEQLGNSNPGNNRPLERARQLLVDQDQILTPAQAEMLVSILKNARAAQDSLSHRTFQELVLGSQRYTEVYAASGRLNSPSYLLAYDRPRLSNVNLQGLASWLKQSGNRAAIFTSRPSKPLPGAFSTPEAELGARLVGLEELPIAGLGGLLWLAARRNAGAHAFLKPSPVHALTGLALALGLPLEDALQSAARLVLDEALDGVWAELDHSRVIAFEDTAGGLRSVQSARELLKKLNIVINLELCGVTTNHLKARALKSAGADMFPDINAALDARLG